MSSLPRSPELSTLGVEARRLEPRDEAIATAFCETCSDFFDLVAGVATARERARQLLASRPPGVASHRKHVIAFERGAGVIAVVDLLEGHPHESTWYVGLLLVPPAERGRGLGAALWRAVEEWIRTQGARDTRLIVQQQNPGAERFWRSMQFVTTGTVEQRLATRTNTCRTMEKSLMPSEVNPALAVPWRFETERLVSRGWDTSDASMLKAAIDANLQHLQAWMPWAMEEPSPVEVIAARLETFRRDHELGVQWPYGVWSLDDARLIGGIGLHRTDRTGTLELGYWIQASESGHGYITEAVNALTAIALDLPGIAQVEIHCDARNDRSMAVARRAGYRLRETLLADGVTPTGETRDTAVWERRR